VFKVNRLSLCLSLGLLGASFVAPTHADVVLYGVVDTGISYVHVTRNPIDGQSRLSGSQFGMDSGVQSGSRWGLKGTEDLGKGLGVSFVLEGGLNSATGQSGQGGRAFGRQATVGISYHRFGQLLMGRQATISTNYFGAIDPFGESFGQANIGASFGSVNTVRYDNLAQYQSPSLYGAQFGVGYSSNTGTSGLYQSGAGPITSQPTEYFGTNANMRALTAAVRVTHEAFNAVASYDRVFAASQVLDPDGSGPIKDIDGATPTAWIVGATYNFGMVELAAAFGRSYDGAFSGNGPGNGLSGTGLSTVTGGAGVLFDSGFNSQSTMIGFTIPMADGSNELMFSWQTQKPQGRLADDPTFAMQSIFGLAYTYGLSKRVNLYFWGSYGSNFQMISSAKSSVVGTGMRYLF
jgi:predicted porin